jgi:predicted AAA+ superfamily ATPase
MRGQANLLAGRAFVNYLFPLTYIELEERFNLTDCLSWGTLPKAVQLKTEIEKQEFLRAYAQTYLKEEIWAEHIIRELTPFRRFLEISAQTNSQIINFSNIAQDIGADPKTVKSYYQILEDTLLGFLLEPFDYSVRKRQRKNPKFYFFDTGVKRALAKNLTQTLSPQSFEYGQAFEQFIIVEMFRLNHYGRKDFSFFYLRTKDDAEIDLIVQRPGMPVALIEIKSKNTVHENDSKSLNRFLKSFKNASAYLLSNDPIKKKIDSVVCLPWSEGMIELGLKP